MSPAAHDTCMWRRPVFGGESEGVAGGTNLRTSSLTITTSGCECICRKWQPSPPFLPGQSHGQKSLVGHNPWGCKRVGHYWATNTSLHVSANVGKRSKRKWHVVWGGWLIVKRRSKWTKSWRSTLKGREGGKHKQVHPSQGCPAEGFLASPHCCCSSRGSPERAPHPFQGWAARGVQLPETTLGPASPSLTYTPLWLWWAWTWIPAWEPHRQHHCVGSPSWNLLGST